MTEAERQLVTAATIATLRTAAGWLTGDDQQMLYEVADQVAIEDPREQFCCPVCEETGCDEDCPLAEVRAGVT